MSAETIYKTLRENGLSPVGACAVLGNMYCESGLKPDIAQRGMTNKTDEQYTEWADHLTNPYDFAHDGVGYGLYQLTYYTRKDGYWYFAKEHGVSVGNEKAQCEYLILELRRDYPKLYDYLCGDCDLAIATQRFCAEFEQPAVNNFADRINAAQRYYNNLADSTEPQPEPQIPVQVLDTCEVTVRILKQGSLGRDVFLLQCGLNDMKFNCGVPDGDFGLNTKEAVCELQRKYNLTTSGTADKAVWDIILKQR